MERQTVTIEGGADPGAEPDIETDIPKRRINTKTVSAIAAALIALFFSGVLIWHLSQEFQAEHVWESLKQLPLYRLAAAFGFAVLGYAVMTAYDALGFVWIGRTRSAKLPYRKIAFACFTGYAISNTLGFASVTGTAVRLRLYTAWGVRVLDALRVIAFSASTTWFGLFALGGLGLALDPRGFDARIHSGNETLWRLIGLAVLAVPVGYIACCIRWGGHVVRFRGREVAFPTARLATAQVIVATVDWILAGLVMYMLLPPAPVSFFQFIASFVAAQGAGIASHVPGGAGVFEASLLAMLRSAGYPVASILAAIVGFRVLYYLIPFAVGCLMLAGHEVMIHGGHLFGRRGEEESAGRE